MNKKTNTIVKVNSIINRRYTYRITRNSVTLTEEREKVTVLIGNQKYTIAEKTTDNKYKLRYDYTQVIGINNHTGGNGFGSIRKP